MSESPGAAPRVVVYWRPGCTFCLMLRTGLRRTGMSYDETNIWSDPAAAEYVRGVAEGNETVPTVRIGDRALVNPTVREVLDTATATDPALTRGIRRPRVSERTVFLVAAVLLAAVVGALLVW